jgi:hypothetical protein
VKIIAILAARMKHKTSLDNNYKEIGKEYENIIDEEAKKIIITLSRS